MTVASGSKRDVRVHTWSLPDVSDLVQWRQWLGEWKSNQQAVRFRFLVRHTSSSSRDKIRSIQSAVLLRLRRPEPRAGDRQGSRRKDIAFADTANESCSTHKSKSAGGRDRSPPVGPWQE